MEQLLKKLENKEAVIGVIGMGYVGLPLGLEFALKGYSVLGFDVDNEKVEKLLAGKGYIKHIKEDIIKQVVDAGNLSATTDFSRMKEVDAIIICVPTPLDKHRQPNMEYVENTALEIAKYLQKGQLVSLESTTYPGTTNEIILPLLEKGVNGTERNWKAGEDFFLAFSPEREDPNNQNFTTSTIPKVVGGVTPNCLKVATALYDAVVVQTVPVSDTKVAEAAKLLENIYRSVNIAMVNELKTVFDKMGIDIWEVIEAAKTKPFGFQAFYPGPGLGGHCIPIDPFYLTWKAYEYDSSTRFIELAGEINTYMPYYVVEKTVETLNEAGKSIHGAKILILGAAYKKDIDDMRESPTLKLIDIFRDRKAEVSYNDPYVPKLPKTRKYHFKMESVELTAENISSFDLVLLSTDHTDYDYAFIYEHAKLIIDTRNAFEKNGVKGEKIKKA